MTSKSSLFPVAVYNCSNRDIVVRYVPLPPNKGGRLLLIARTAGTMHDAHEGMAVFAADASDEMVPYAQVIVTAQAREIHFTESAGNYGRGVMPDPLLEPPSGLGRRQPAQQQQQPLQQEPLEPAITRDHLLAPSEAPGIHVAAPLSAQQPAAPLAAPVDGQRGDGREEVPGLGWLRVSELKPEMQAHVRALQAAAKQQEQQGGPEPPPPLPQYSLPSNDMAMALAVAAAPSEGGLLDRLLDSWTLPALVLLLAVLALSYLAVYKPYIKSDKSKRAAARARRWS